jgi:putative sigma-54 modulation protein|tara:strand:- start:83 stop:433 length:351 start_codon:yes stop_codon:yes gene_type:complete
MQISISGQHLEVTEALRLYVTRKLERIDRHAGPPLIRAHVVLHTEKNRSWAEGTVHTKGTQWHATAEGSDMYAVIDRVVDKLDRQAIKHKEKVVDHHQQDGGLKSRAQPDIISNGD